MLNVACTASQQHGCTLCQPSGASGATFVGDVPAAEAPKEDAAPSVTAAPKAGDPFELECQNMIPAGSLKAEFWKGMLIHEPI